MLSQTITWYKRMKCLIFLLAVGSINANEEQKEKRQLGAIPGSCTGDKVDCQSYGTTICTDSKYTGWVHDNCCLYCATQLGTGGGHAGTNPGHGGSQIGHSVGCVYNGQIYQQGQKWRDGCKYDCTCTDANSGKYNCETICLQWNNLPQACTMSPPAAGKCCSEPNCPPNIQIQYPPGYTPQ